VLKILITNQKGGVGKSTISANLAYYFASVQDKRTTLIDFDTQGSSSKWVKAVKPQIIGVYNAKLPLSGGTNRILIDCRNIMRMTSKKADIIIADLTWFDVFDSEMFLDFDLVVLPTAISEVELIATMEFAERHQWVFNSKGQHPSLVIAPSRVRKDQGLTFKHSTERFPFSFILTPPVLDSIEAKKSFCKNYILNLKKHNLKESFLNFCQAIEQTAKIHNSQKIIRNKLILSTEQTKISRLNSGLNYEIKKADALNKIQEDKESVSYLLDQPSNIKVDNINLENDFIAKNNLINSSELVGKNLGNIDVISKRKAWGKKNITVREPILNLDPKKRKSQLKPISSYGRQLMIEPPLFLKKQSS
jgi:cellulose biosynthesis protein BcsQ